MVKIRLQRLGSNKSPFYRVVATDATSPRDGRLLEIIGTYNPVKNPAIVDIDKEKAAKWINNGAKPTETVKNLFKKYSVLEK